MTSQAYWERLVRAHPAYDTVEKLRDAIDAPGWRARENAKRLALKASEAPARTIDASVGAVKGRAYRQVNVKLGEPDFAALKALAIDRDLPPATMARVLLRNAIRNPE